MKSENVFFAVLVGGVIAYRLLRKPAYRATWSLFTGPKFYADLTQTIQSGDQEKISRLRMSYESWPEESQRQFNDSVRKLGLKRPW